MSKVMILKPLLSEKSFGLSKSERTYAFSVPNSANKLTIAEAVRMQFEVSVEGVKVANIKGKPKRTILGGRPVYGQRTNVKKAYVTLKEGDSLPIFAEEEKAEAKAKKAEEKTKDEPSKPAGAKLVETEVKQKRGLRQAFSRTPRQTQNRGGEK